jgi:hypothetical protein
MGEPWLRLRLYSNFLYQQGHTLELMIGERPFKRASREDWPYLSDERRVSLYRK